MPPMQMPGVEAELRAKQREVSSLNRDLIEKVRWVRQISQCFHWAERASERQATFKS